MHVSSNIGPLYRRGEPERERLRGTVECEPTLWLEKSKGRRGAQRECLLSSVHRIVGSGGQRDLHDAVERWRRLGLELDDATETIDHRVAIPPTRIVKVL